MDTYGLTQVSIVSRQSQRPLALQKILQKDQKRKKEKKGTNVSDHLCYRTTPRTLHAANT